MRAVVVDLMCNSPVYSAEFTKALVRVGIAAELASPRFYLEPELLDSCPRPSWLVDLVVHARRPRLLRLAVRAVEGSVNFLRLIASIRSGQYDVVHVQWTPFEGRATPFLPMLRRACDRTGTLLVFTAHNAAPHDAVRRQHALEREMRAPHLIQALTQHVADELAQNVTSATPIVVIPLGPQLTDHVLPAKADAAARLDDPSSPVVLFQGSIRPYKGLDLLRQAWPQVVDAFPSASLLVVGKAAGAEARGHVDQLRELPSVRVIDRYVSFHELLDCFAVADLVVFPYRRISQSGALMTAAGLGKPVVVTPIDGFREQVATLRSAVMADEVSGDAIARALIAGIERRYDLAELAARDRLAIQESPIGWPAVAAAARRAYEASALASR
jgi:glycosyltransferase involved in cell wall biosynthesis